MKVAQLSLVIIISTALVACGEGFKADKSLSAEGPSYNNHIQNPMPHVPSTPNNPSSSDEIKVCDELVSVRNTGMDASDIILNCISQTPVGHTLELPPGIYTISKQIKITKSITLRTQGKSLNQARCFEGDAHDCAELRASPHFFEKLGLLFLGEEASPHVHHIVINGYREARMQSNAAQECRRGETNHYGFNMMITCSNCSFTKSVSKNALCGTGVQVANVQDVNVSFNAILKNGIHNQELMWADGLTVGDASHSTFNDNEISDNSDVDLIFGGCQNCEIKRNRITHSGTFSNSSFAAMMIYVWPGSSSGNYNGSNITSNYIDCGPYKRCGFGLYIGADAWILDSRMSLYGGSVNNNYIVNAQQGFAIDRTTQTMEVYDNFVTLSGGRFKTSCGDKDMTSHSKDSQSIIDFSKDSLPSALYANINWDNCIPNWWQQ